MITTDLREPLREQRVTRRDLDDLENRLIIKLGGSIVVAVGLAIAVLGFLISTIK